MTTAERLWTIHDVAEYLGIPVSTLYYWRCKKRGPLGKRMGRHIRYRAQDVYDWLDQQTHPYAN